MTQAQIKPKLYSFDEFMNWYPETAEVRYELHNEEYWILDYAALGARKFIGNPKQPTLFVCTLVEGEYQMNPFTENKPIVSPTFPQFNLSAQEIFALIL